MKKLLLIIIALFIGNKNHAQLIDSSQLIINEIEASLKYQKGIIELESGNATLTVPEGFNFLDKEQSIYVLTDLWGNPADSTIIGMLVPENGGILGAKSWAFTISFDEIGYVKDDDAESFNYDDLLADQQKEFKEYNPERVKLGYQPIELIGWASTPFYDKEKKVLHWAKELKFGTDSLNTLNYNLRILGRKGIFMLNAVATMRELPEVQNNIDKVINSVTFKKGHTYEEYIPDVDNVAAWTIGGLVAGKILTKVGFFVLLAKFWKVIAIAVAAGGGAVWNFFKRKKKRKEEQEEQALIEEYSVENTAETKEESIKES